MNRDVFETTSRFGATVLIAITAANAVRLIQSGAVQLRHYAISTGYRGKKWNIRSS